MHQIILKCGLERAKNVPINEQITMVVIFDSPAANSIKIIVYFVSMLSINLNKRCIVN